MQTEMPIPFTESTSTHLYAQTQTHFASPAGGTLLSTGLKTNKLQETNLLTLSLGSERERAKGKHNTRTTARGKNSFTKRCTHAQ